MLNLMIQLQPENAQKTDKNTRIEMLAEKASCGSGDALYELCESIAKDILFHATHIMSNRADAEDVTQETLIRVCEKIRNLRDPKQFRAWLGKIITNEAKRYLAKNARRGVVLNIVDYLEAIMEENNDFLPQECAESGEFREAVMEIIAELPMRQREAVMLHYYDGLNITQTAAAMGINKQAASKYIALAKEKLKREIEKRQLLGGISNMTAAVPIGFLLKDILNREAKIFSADTQVNQALGRCREYISSDRMISASKRVGRLITGTLAAAIAASALSFVSSVEKAQTERTVEGGVVFSGGFDYGDNRAYVNPETAEPEVESTIGSISTIYWWITRAGDEAVLYSGENQVVDEALRQLLENGEKGEYVIYFRLTDEVGSLYRLSSNFYMSGGSPGY